MTNGDSGNEPSPSPFPNTRRATHGERQRYLDELARRAPNARFLWRSGDNLLAERPMHRHAVPRPFRDLFPNHRPIPSVRQIVVHDHDHLLSMLWAAIVARGIATTRARLRHDPDTDVLLHLVSAPEFGTEAVAVVVTEPTVIIDPRCHVEPRMARPRRATLGVERKGEIAWLEDPSGLLRVGLERHVGASAIDLVHPDDYELAVSTWFEAVNLPGQPITRRIRHRTSDATWSWLDTTYLVHTESSAVVHVTLTEIPPSELDGFASAAGQEKFLALSSSLPIGVIQITIDLEVVHVNDRLREILGASHLTHTWAEAQEIVHPEDRRALNLALIEVLGNGTDQDLTVRIRREDDQRERHCRLRGRAVRDGDTIVGAIASVDDVTERLAMQRQLEHQARTDPLTGLANRTVVREVLDAACEGPASGPIAVVFIDLDGFKMVNDAHGHHHGDQVLVEIGARLEAALMPPHLVARLGGDEFVIVLTGEHGAEPLAVARRALDEIRRPMVVEDVHIEVDGSIGIASMHDSDCDGDRLLSNADLAMYESKQSGGAIAVFESALREASTARLALRRELTRAVAGNEFGLLFQPIVDLGSHRWVGAECLLRWEHPRRGRLSPDDFLGGADDAGVAEEIGARVITQAFAAFAPVVDRFGERFCLNINLSGRQLVDDHFVGHVDSLATEYQVTRSNIVFEVTENMVIDPDSPVVANLRELRSVGFRIALDDFGTGYSSLAGLRHAPSHLVKIDGSFTAELGRERVSLLIVRSVAELARQLGKSVIAEGVETVEQVEVLRSIGVTLGQGFLFARPRSLDELVAPDGR